MHSIFTRVALALTLATPFACTEPEAGEPENLVEPDVPLPTDNGRYTVTLTPLDAAAWPPSVGINKFKMKVAVGPDPMPNDPQVSVSVEPPVRWPEFDLTAAPPDVTPDGPYWLIAVDFVAPGVWNVPVDVSGAGDDSMVFSVEVRE